MHLDRLKTFAAAADLRSFSRAAELRQLTQPSVTQQMRELEAFFGVALFERVGNQMVPTPAAVRLRGHVGRILAEFDAAREGVREFQGDLSGNLTVGSGNTVGMYLLPRMLGAFRQSAPHVRIAMRLSSSHGELLDALSWRDIDLALLESESPPKHRKGLAAERFASDEIVLFVSPGHPLAGREAISPDELLGVPLLSRPEGSPTRLLIWRRLADAGLDTEALDNPMQVGNTEALKQAVQADLGAGFASRFALRQEVRLGLLVIVPIRGIRISRTLWMVWNDSASMPVRLERFKRFLVAEAPAHMDTGCAR